MLLLLYLGCTADQGSILLGYFLHLLVQGHLLCVLESLCSLPGVLKESRLRIKEVAGDKGSGDAIKVDVQTLSEAVFWTWVYYPQLPKCQDFQSIGFQIKGILL
jgi:hypothetical protein